MRSLGRLRCASANSRPTISGVAPASAKYRASGQRVLTRPGAGVQLPPNLLRDLDDGGPRYHSRLLPVVASPPYGTEQRCIAAAGGSGDVTENCPRIRSTAG